MKFCLLEFTAFTFFSHPRSESLLDLAFVSDVGLLLEALAAEIFFGVPFRETFRGISRICIQSLFAEVPVQYLPTCSALLINDVSRGWKTILVSYEARGGMVGTSHQEISERHWSSVPL
jgi:hypothetical protein